MVVPSAVDVRAACSVSAFSPSSLPHLPHELLGWVLQLGPLSLFQGHQNCIRASEECEVGSAPALIQECSENYFMTVSSTDFDKGEGGS